MVERVTSLTGNGLRDWLIQRITSIVLAAYALFLFIYVLICSPLTFAHWQALFNHELMRVFTFLALLSVVYHAWVGLWTIFTDYIKCPCARLTLQTLVVLALLGYLVWGIDIVWGF